MLKDARKVVIQLADTTAFANANLGEIEVLMKETVPNTIIWSYWHMLTQGNTESGDC